MGRLKGKVAIVTGGAAGMGLSHSTVFAREGATVIVADRDQAAGEQAVSEINRAGGGKASFLSLDVASKDDWGRVIGTVEKEYGRLDILVNNAGIIRLGPTEALSLEDWEAVFAVNVRGVFLGSQAAIPVMRRGGRGSIINISSTVGVVAIPGAAAYVASKGAVTLLTKATAAEVAADGIRVNSVHPGLTPTNMTKGVIGNPDAKDIYTMLLGPALIARPAEPTEISNAVLFLASDESSYVTGSELVADGGYLAV